MNIDYKTTLHMNEYEVKTAIALVLKQKGYTVSSENIELNVSIKRWTDGYGMAETDHQEAMFEGATVILDK